VAHIGLVVEGFGELDAVPVVVRAHLQAKGEWQVQPGRPFNCKGRDKVINVPGELERYIIGAAEPGAIGVLTILDEEGDGRCPLGPSLQQRADVAVPHLKTPVTLAVRKFENWIAASGESVFEKAWEPPSNDYEGTGAVEFIERCQDGVYSKTAHQAGLASRMDHELVRSRCPSFERLQRCIDELLAP
jgi:hypothetical protein